MKPLIQESPLRDSITSVDGDNNMLLRTFFNGSAHFFSYAFLSAERIRGISTAAVVVDEIQDMNFDFLPVIEETMSGHVEHNSLAFTGTPKSLDNTIEALWQDSSMAEQAIKCEACNYWNIASVAQDLLKMIGKNTCICASCGKPLNCYSAVYIHAVPDRRPDFSGYHASQVTHPYHCTYPHKWKTLLHKMENYPDVKFKNECLGESCDNATRLITINDLVGATAPERTNTVRSALQKRPLLTTVAMGVDWGGGGDTSSSYTAVAIVGSRPGSDSVETIYLEKFNRSMSVEEEVANILALYKKFNPQFLAHDYGGAGAIREAMLLQAGVSPNKIIPYSYVMAPSKSVIRYVKSQEGYRKSYNMDKPRSLAILCTMIKAKKIILPEWETSKECLGDFLNLVEDYQERPRGSSVFIISKIAGRPDDICHALNYAASCIWYSQQRYPDMVKAFNIEALQKKKQEIMDQNDIDPENPDWDDDEN